MQGWSSHPHCRKPGVCLLVALPVAHSKDNWPRFLSVGLQRLKHPCQCKDELLPLLVSVLIVILISQIGVVLPFFIFIISTTLQTVQIPTWNIRIQMRYNKIRNKGSLKRKCHSQITIETSAVFFSYYRSFWTVFNYHSYSWKEACSLNY